MLTLDDEIVEIGVTFPLVLYCFVGLAFILVMIWLIIIYLLAFISYHFPNKTNTLWFQLFYKSI